VACQRYPAKSGARFLHQAPESLKKIEVIHLHLKETLARHAYDGEFIILRSADGASDHARGNLMDFKYLEVYHFPLSKATIFCGIEG
jgi:hypothetical protein